jgi:hypothetical protein
MLVLVADSCTDWTVSGMAPFLKRSSEEQSSPRELARKLRILVPPTWPVQVRTVQLSESHGDCELVKESKRGPHFRIRLAKSLSLDAAQFALIHEWAHCLSWGSESHRISHHGPEWGIAMSRIWQALMEE